MENKKDDEEWNDLLGKNVLSSDSTRANRPTEAMDGPSSEHFEEPHSSSLEISKTKSSKTTELPLRNSPSKDAVQTSSSLKESVPSLYSKRSPVQEADEQDLQAKKSTQVAIYKSKESERNRRTRINDRFEELKEMLPSSKEGHDKKMKKEEVLIEAIAYIKELVEKRDDLDPKKSRKRKKASPEPSTKSKKLDGKKSSDGKKKSKKE